MNGSAPFSMRKKAVTENWSFGRTRISAANYDAIVGRSCSFGRNARSAAARLSATKNFVGPIIRKSKAKKHKNQFFMLESETQSELVWLIG